jgi:hypothetical protein
MRDSNMPASGGNLVIDDTVTLTALDILDTTRPEQAGDVLLPELVIEELDFWWGAPLPINGAVNTCMSANDPVAGATLAIAGDLA